MSESKKYFQFGLTASFPCNYLSDMQERLIVVTNNEDVNQQNYQALMSAGFRRSGDQVYRPHCSACQACESLRVPVAEFKPSKSQKRLRNLNQDLTIRVVNQPKPSYYTLYERYINTVHRDGSMFPANKEQYEGFIFSKRIPQLFIEIYDQEQLICVAVCDHLPDALSALYTFYHPQHQKRSLGRYAILQQIELAATLQKDYLYLGYQIDNCQKMNYKKQYLPHERLRGNDWLKIAAKN
ncbi:arginyltransferase [Thalassotalea ponticola]|uniref:arginyltransferase n=1 Tax=Thalassotalea ponticola TaxID=1523392 RepID=UPI0025B34B48|nr:arginyltransferase [Thalassotalea ponticola]MDN3651447.1 arginyltransferase [Thalassotalea ponticola]